MHPQAAIFIRNDINLACVVALIYDLILHLPQEVELIWKHKWSRGTLLYVTIRYFTLGGFILTLIPYFIDWSESTCNVFTILTQAFVCANTITISSVFAMRTYALYDRSKPILILLVLAALSLLGIAGWALASQRLSDPEPSDEASAMLHGCHVSTSAAQARRLIVSWGCVVAFDTLLFSLTAARAVRRASITFRIQQQSSYTRLVKVIYRDVAVYYFVMMTFNIATVLCFSAAPDLFRGAMATPTSVISALLCARLILNIREAASATSWMQATHEMSSIRFQETNFEPRGA